MVETQVNDTDQPDPKEPESAEKQETKKPDPTRFGDWEKNGRCVDF